MNIFTFFENLKVTFKFGLLVAMSKALSPPPPLGTKRQVRTGGGPWHGRSNFSSLGWQDFHGPSLIWPAFLDFFSFLQNKSERHHCRGKVLKQKILRKHFSRNTIFSDYFLLKRFWAVSIQKIQVTYDLGCGRYSRVNLEHFTLVVEYYFLHWLWNTSTWILHSSWI